MLFLFDQAFETDQQDQIKSIMGEARPYDADWLIILSGNALKSAQNSPPPLAGAFILTDPDAAVSGYLKGDFGNTGPTILVVDRTMRLHARLLLGDPSALQALKSCHQAVRPGAPVLQIPSVFAADECSRLIDHFNKHDQSSSPSFLYDDGTVEMRPDPAQKTRMDHIVEDDALTMWLMDVVATRIVPETQHAFNFRPKGAEKFKLVSYSASDSGHFAVHRDNISPDTANRRYALTVNLNTHDYEGGGLSFPEYDPTPVAPAAGGAVVFSCSLAHQVMPVTSGTRFALINFFTV